MRLENGECLIQLLYAVGVTASIGMRLHDRAPKSLFYLGEAVGQLLESQHRGGVNKCLPSRPLLRPATPEIIHHL